MCTCNVSEGDEICDASSEWEYGANIVVQKLSQCFQNLPTEAGVPLQQGVGADEHGRPGIAYRERVAGILQHSRQQEPD